MLLRRALLPLLPLLLASSAPRQPVGPRGAAAPPDTTLLFPRGWEMQRGSIAPTVAARGMVVTTDRVASEVGSEIMRRNGNAVDVAVAVHFALAVVNPEAGNIGGGGFMVVRMADGTVASLDFREAAPQKATRDMYLTARGTVSDTLSLVGHLASGVPGSVAGMWEAHKRFGKLPWAELVQPAINLAEGIVIHERLAGSMRRNQQILNRYPETQRIFAPGGRLLLVGDRLVQADLAQTLRRIQQNGADGFYRGRTAELIEAEMQRGGGVMTRDDLARYRAVWREPLRFTYRGNTIISMPPPSSGGATMAEMLKILEGYDLKAAGFLSPRYVHLFTEAARRAYADRNAYLADPDFVPQPVARMISEPYAASRRATLNLDRATPSAAIAPGLGAPPAEGTNTTHYSIVDGLGNAVAVTTTLNSLYGSGVTVAGAGIVMNNEMDDFTAKPGVPNQFGLVQGAANAIAPGKRMLSAMTPTIILDGRGRLRAVTGTPGGSTIITSIAQMVSNIVDFDMDVATAELAPRLHHQHLPDTLRFERRGLEDSTVARLRQMGHAMAEREGYQGDLQTIIVLPNGYVTGASDPRRGGAAVGLGEVRRVVQ
ncbi:MAG TPA: gamma-glutamyltransferase [Longimicrobium sp.]|nr:gamma-glutamyltransferase [Longimicrobium sp.]